MSGVIPVEVDARRTAPEVVARGRGEPLCSTAGEEASGEFRCAGCGYGVVVRRLLPACPMCRGHVWEVPAGSPFRH